MEKKTTLKISIIGSGRLGSTLAYAINNSGSQEAEIVSVSNRTEKTLAAAKELLGDSSRKILFTVNNFLAASISNCIFICTPDDVIEKACSEIFNTVMDFKKEENKKAFSNKTEKNIKSKFNFMDTKEMAVFHFSGSKKTDVLKSARKAGASAACMHPLKSFASVLEAAETLENTLYGVTYDNNDIGIKKTIDILIKILKGRTIFVENDKKTLYHACACIASNYLVSLMDFATDTGTEVGLDASVFLSGLLNLSEGTLLNIKKLGTKKALTGPIARGDISTINEHIEIIKSLKREDIKEFYDVMGKKTAKIAYENNWIIKKTHDELLKLFKK